MFTAFMAFIEEVARVSYERDKAIREGQRETLYFG